VVVGEFVCMAYDATCGLWPHSVSAHQSVKCVLCGCTWEAGNLLISNRFMWLYMRGREPSYWQPFYVVHKMTQRACRAGFCVVQYPGWALLYSSLSKANIRCPSWECPELACFRSPSVVYIDVAKATHLVFKEVPSIGLKQHLLASRLFY